MSLTSRQTIDLEAFQAVLDVFYQRGFKLPEVIQRIADDPLSHIDDLDEIAEKDPTFDGYYQTARQALQTTARKSERRLSPNSAEPKNQSQQTYNFQLDHRINENVRGSQSDTVVPVNSGHLSSPSMAPNPESSPVVSPPVRRFVLPKGSTEDERVYFAQYIAELKQLNPGWIISPAPRHPNEDDAYVMMYQDANYPATHASILLTEVIEQSIQRFLS